MQGNSEPARRLAKSAGAFYVLTPTVEASQARGSRLRLGLGPHLSLNRFALAVSFNPTVRSALFDRYAVTSDRIIRELALIAFANIGDFIGVQDDGSLVVDFGTATREQMASLKSIETMGAAPGVRRVMISMSDKRQALMDLAKLRRMLPADRLEHSGSIEHVVPEEHKIDIELMTPEEREQLRTILLKAGADKAV